MEQTQVEAGRYLKSYWSNLDQKMLDSGYIVKGEPTGFPYRLNMGCD